MNELNVYWVPVIGHSIILELYVSLPSIVLGIELTVKDLLLTNSSFLINEMFQACKKKKIKE